MFVIVRDLIPGPGPAVLQRIRRDDLSSSVWQRVTARLPRGGRVFAAKANTVYKVDWRQRQSEEERK